MRSQAAGAATSPTEVTSISRHGFWPLANGEELFLPFSEFPWFREARVADILQVEQPHPDHFCWPALDVDLTRDSVRHPERYPLVATPGTAAVHEADAP